MSNVIEEGERAQGEWVAIGQLCLSEKMLIAGVTSRLDARAPPKIVWSSMENRDSEHLNFPPLAQYTVYSIFVNSIRNFKHFSSICML